MPIDARIPLGITQPKFGDIARKAREDERERQEAKRRARLQEAQTNRAETERERAQMQLDDLKDQRVRQEQMQFYQAAGTVSALLEEGNHDKARKRVLAYGQELRDKGADGRQLIEVMRIANLIDKSPLEAGVYFKNEFMPMLEENLYQDLRAQQVEDEKLAQNGRMNQFAGDLILDTANNNTPVGVMQTNNRGRPTFHMFSGESLDTIDTNRYSVTPSAALGNEMGNVITGALDAKSRAAQILGEVENDLALQLQNDKEWLTYQNNIEMTIGARTEALQQAEDGYQLMSGWVSQALDKANGWNTGLLGAAAKHIPGTDAYDLAAIVESLKANIGFDELQKMREASATGGALGQVSNQEISFLQALLGNLDQAQSKEQFIGNLQRLQEAMDVVVNRGTDEFNRLYGTNVESPAGSDQRNVSSASASSPAPDQAQSDRIDELMSIQNPSPEQEAELLQLLRDAGY